MLHLGYAGRAEPVSVWYGGDLGFMAVRVAASITSITQQQQLLVVSLTAELTVLSDKHIWITSLQLPESKKLTKIYKPPQIWTITNTHSTWKPCKSIPIKLHKLWTLSTHHFHDGLLPGDGLVQLLQTQRELTGTAHLAESFTPLSQSWSQIFLSPATDRQITVLHTGEKYIE